MSRPEAPKRRPKAASPVKMADVARRAGVSLMTVSRVYNAPDLVSAETRVKVQRIADRLGYIPNLVAGNLASGRSGVITAIVPSLSNSYFAATLQGMAEALRQVNLHLVMAESGYDLENEARVISVSLGRRPDGIMLIGSKHSPAAVAMIRSSGIPAVETWETRGPFIDMAVGFSHFDAARDLVTYLIDRGHRRIGYIDHLQPQARRHLDRTEGIRQTLREAGLPDTIYVAMPDVGGFSTGRSALQRLLELDAGISAVICATDVYAAGAIFECTARGIRVPQQLAVCGFGDLEVAGAIEPPLTTINTNAYRIGTEAGAMLIARISGRKPRTRVVDVGYSLIQRESA